MEYSYEALKAYQMLYQPKHYDGKFLHSWVMLNLQRNLPQNVTQAQLQELEWHLTQLLEPKIQASPYAQDEDLVARERALINQQPLSTRVYGRLKRLLEHDENLKPVSLSDLGGPQSELVFSRKSGKPVSEGVPGLYTPDGYWKSFNDQIDSVTTALHEDDARVLGATTAQKINSRSITPCASSTCATLSSTGIAFSLTFSSTTAPIFPSALTPRACFQAPTRRCAVWCLT